MTYTITKAPLTVVANDVVREYGEENPAFNCSYMGFKNDENASVLTKQSTFSTNATASSVPGTYYITPYGAEADNYSFNYERGTLTITKAKNQITWEQKIEPMEIGDAVHIAYSVKHNITKPTFEDYDADIVSIVRNGDGWDIKAKAPGTTTIAMYMPGNDLYEQSNIVTRTITVKNPPVVVAESIVLNNTSLELSVGKSEQLVATVLPSDAMNKNVIWTSSNESVASVDSYGRVVAKAAGVAIVTATAEGNPAVKAECAVTVLQPATGLTLNQTSIKFTSIGETVQLVATVLPEDASNKAVSWMSTDNTVCMVTQEGTVVATGRGHAVVIATAVDGGFMAICNVTVTTFHKLTYLVDGEEYYSETLEYGSVIAPKEAPTKEGYTFSGWSNLPVTMPAEDVVVTGSFTINSYDVIYFVDEVEYMRQAYNYGESVVALEAPKKDGYLFSGWSEIPETMPAHDVNVYGTMIVDGINSMYSASGKFTVYTAQGTWLKADASIDDIKTLPNGLYIINGKKVVIK